MSIKCCRLVNLPTFQDSRGNLTFVEANKHVPFDIQRVFYLYDVPDGSDRGGHALKNCHQLLIAISGSFDVVLDDGQEKKRVHLARSSCGLQIPPTVWREMDNFSSGSICMVLASNTYDEDDYYRNYSEYLAVMGLK
jgi:WxcM-like, C-terminal.